MVGIVKYNQIYMYSLKVNCNLIKRYMLPLKRLHLKFEKNYINTTSTVFAIRYGQTRPIYQNNRRRTSQRHNHIARCLSWEVCSNFRDYNMFPNYFHQEFKFIDEDNFRNYQELNMNHMYFTFTHLVVNRNKIVAIRCTLSHVLDQPI